MIKAAEKWNLDKARFTTYSRLLMDQTILAAIPDYLFAVKLPKNLQIYLNWINAKIEQIDKKGRSPEEMPPHERLATETILESHRKLGAAIKLPVSLEEEYGKKRLSDVLASSEPTPLGNLLARERSSRVKKLLKSLTPEERRVIELRFFEEKPPEEVQKILGIRRAKLFEIEKSAWQKLGIKGIQEKFFEALPNQIELLEKSTDPKRREIGRVMRMLYLEQLPLKEVARRFGRSSRRTLDRRDAFFRMIGFEGVSGFLLGPDAFIRAERRLKGIPKGISVSQLRRELADLLNKEKDLTASKGKTEELSRARQRIAEIKSILKMD